MYCPNCGRSIRPTRFCIYCGKKLPEACFARKGAAPSRRAARPARQTRRALVSAAAVTAAVVCAAAALAIHGVRQASARLGAQIGSAVTRK